jgi:hypothetical protein
MKKINKLKGNYLPRSKEGDQFLSKFLDGLEQNLAFLKKNSNLNATKWGWLEKSSLFVITFAL